MQSYDFLLTLAVILLSTKLFGLLSEKVHMPQVVGALFAGLMLGPAAFNLVEQTDFILKISQLGVIMLMFLAGLDTELDELKKVGFAAVVVAIFGVVLPLTGGTVCYQMFFRGFTSEEDFLKALFIGVVLTATSVSITVETLREMGKLKGRIGTTILGAAIIDDILGIIVLTFISSFASSDVNISNVVVNIIMFFVFILLVGFVMHKVFIRMEIKWANHRRLAIVSLAFCIILAYISEEFFGVADITGAYFAGVILCNILGLREYVAKKINVMNYMFFAPVFFAVIGIKTDLKGISMEIAIFSIILLLVAIFTKVLGCALGARMCKFPKNEAIAIGIGMVSRGEVALIVAQKGDSVGLVDPLMFPAIVLVVIVTTLITPILLKIFMEKEKVKT